jgi:shikimate kinase
MSGRRYFNVLVGPMSSGKTTFARRFWPVASMRHHIMDESPPASLPGAAPAEALRRRAAESWRGLESAVADWLDGGAEECFVADGLFMSRQSREAVLGLVPRGAVSARVAWFLDTPPQTLIGRFRRRVDAGEFPFVPREVLLKQLLCFEMPSPEEPFDMWIRVPVPDQEGHLPDGADALSVMAHRAMFLGGDPVPRCDFLDEAARVGRYVFRDMGVRP